MGKLLEWRAEELEAMLSDAIISSAKWKNVILFIDALDEAGESANVVINLLHRLNDRFAEQNCKVRICVSCRH